MNENICRLDTSPIEVRAAQDRPTMLAGVLAPFNAWAEIRSMREGHFLERVSPAAFNRTLASERRPKVLFDHGHDPSIGNKPLGIPRSIKVDADGVRYEVELFDTQYVRELLPAIAAGQMGSSWRMSVKGDEWHEPRSPQPHNPTALPERTITDLDLHEFGPVTFPAYASTSAGLRSHTDAFYDDLLDPIQAARLAERVGPKVAERILEALASKPEGDALGTSGNARRAQAGRSLADLHSLITTYSRRS
jgi:HK97 family phage prohead protease